MSKKALITGITGQDGSYLAELLLSKGYTVHAIIRRSSTFNTGRIQHIFQDPQEMDRRLFLCYGDLTTGEQVSNLVHNIRPDEIYHLAAQSHVQVSFDTPEYTNDVGALGTIRLLEAIRHSGIETRLYNAASSEMFGDSPPPQNEQTSFRPRSPYAAAKVHSFWMTRMYREGHGLFATNGILFNHGSPRRGETFVTRKITRAIAQIMAGNQDRLYLGNLDARRDWGYAPEYVEAMWMMLQRDTPDDFVLGMGESHSVREFVEEAFAYVGLDWQEYVEIDPRYFRTLEVESLLADPSKAREVLGWAPTVTFPDLVRIMIDADLQALGLQSPGEGERLLKDKFQDWHQWEGAVVKSLAAQQARGTGAQRPT